MRVASTLLLLLAGAIPAAAEPLVHTPPSFPGHIQQVHATDTGAYLLDGGNQIWFVEPNGAAREVPTPIRGRIRSLDYEPSGGLLWGCTPSDVFATNAAGAWLSWALPEDPARQNCHVAPSPGTTWLLLNSTGAEGPVVETARIGDGLDASLAWRRTTGTHFARVVTDEAGGIWAHAEAPFQGLAHFDGSSWRIWSANRAPWLQTDFVDVFAFPTQVWPQLLASDGTGGLVAPSATQFVFMRSTAPYPAVDLVDPQTPGFGLPNGTLGVGGQRIWGLGRTESSLVLASWDFSGHLATAEPVARPRWFRHNALWNTTTVGADVHAVWVAVGGVLIRRDPNGFTFFAHSSTIDRLRQQGREGGDSIYETIGLSAAAGSIVIAGPAFYAASFGVAYPRVLLETALGWGAGAVTHWAVVSNEPWGRRWSGRLMLGFGLVLNTGIATVATITPETFFVADNEPFPIGGAVLGGAIGYTTGALFDLLIYSVGVESKVARALLWSSFTALGAPLGFHAMRGPLGAD